MHWQDLRIADLLGGSPETAAVRPGNVATKNLPVGPDGEMLACASRAI